MSLPLDGHMTKKPPKPDRRWKQVRLTARAQQTLKALAQQESCNVTDLCHRIILEWRSRRAADPPTEAP